MCVICASPKGIKQPSYEEIKSMFDRNPDGAGYMVARNNMVYIHKGFMYLSDLWNAICAEHFTEQDSVVYHFRISTQAGIDPSMTHPFPLSNQREYLKALDVRCGCGIAHNGIIQLTADPEEQEYSDTAIFIADYLSDIIEGPRDLYNPEVLDVIQALIGSKMAILDASGYIATIGQFYNDEGLLYSNLNHRYYNYSSRL